MQTGLNNTNTIQINPIAPRANAKIVEVGDRRFLIGGITITGANSCEIYQVRAFENEEKEKKVEWKLTKFKNHIFSPRNSFSACGGSNNKFYIWGGLESQQNHQTCFSQLIQVNVESYSMKELPLVQKIAIHSSVLMYDQQNNQLLAIGGTNEDSNAQSYLYTLKLSLGPDEKEYEWKKCRLDCEAHRGHLWQHSAHLTKTSIFSGSPGNFLNVIGGCHFPQSPYNSIVEFDLNEKKVTNQIQLKSGIVGHDSLVSGNSIVIFGGVIGGDLNRDVITLSDGKLNYYPSFAAFGCAAFQDAKCFYVVGGFSSAQSLNRVNVVDKQKINISLP